MVSNIHNANIFRLYSFRAVGGSYRKVLQKYHLPYRFIRTPCSKNCSVVSCAFDTTRVLLLSEFWFQPVLLGKKQKASKCFAHKPSLCYVKYVHVTSSSSSAVSTSNPTRTCSYVPTTTSMNETLDQNAEIVAGIADRRPRDDESPMTKRERALHVSVTKCSMSVKMTERLLRLCMRNKRL